VSRGSGTERLFGGETTGLTAPCVSVCGHKCQQQDYDHNAVVVVAVAG